MSEPTPLDLTLHCHDFPQVWYCYEDFFDMLIGEKRYEMQKGTLLVLPSGVMHRIVIPAGSAPKAFRINVNYNIFGEEAPEEYLNAKMHLFMGAFRRELRLEELGIMSLTQMVQRKVFALFSQLEDSGRAQGDPAAVRSEKLSTEKLLLLEEIFSMSGTVPDEWSCRRIVSLWQTKIRPMTEVMAYVNENFHKKILISDMQKLTFLGHSTFYETFRKFTCFSFTTYLQIIRLKKAHLMMRDTEDSIAQIASMCGFNSHSHMERMYKKYSGVCSSQARAHSIAWSKEYGGRSSL